MKTEINFQNSDLRSLTISSIIFLGFCSIFSMFVNFDFLVGVFIGFTGSVFWLFTLYKDILLSVSDGRISRIRLGYLLRLVVSGLLLFLSSKISEIAFFGAFLGLMNVKISVLISGLFRKF
ncbi:MAG: hypothetical protein PWQ48_1045 [Thermotogaceae bacterium]|jgi:hypothetical protein|nr:hypothetical protein [Thermotogaceae bacterium]